MTLEQLKALHLIETIDARYGKMSFLRTDTYIAQSFGYYGEFSESEVRVFDKLVGQGNNVVSAGANIGAHIVWFAKAVGEKGRVITAEPQGVLHAILMENIAQNELQNVEAYNCALGADVGTVHMPLPDYRYPLSFGSLGVGRGQQAVWMRRIDDLVGERDVRLIHLDVEGAEEIALHGAAKTIERCRPYLYVEYDRPDKREALKRLLRAWGYEAMVHEAPLYNPENFRANPMNCFGGLVSISLFGVPR